MTAFPIQARYLQPGMQLLSENDIMPDEPIVQIVLRNDVVLARGAHFNRQWPADEKVTSYWSTNIATDRTAR